jgi:uncharacterized protein YgbK (DUF1537 family)
MRDHCHYLILDVPDQEALATIAQAVREVRVLCGSSALAEELPALWDVPPTSTPSIELPPHTGAGMLCVAGSLMPQTAAQIRHLEESGTPTWELNSLHLLDEEERATERERISEELAYHLQRGEDVLLYASNDTKVVEQTREAGAERGLTTTEVARLVSTTLADIVAEVVNRVGANRIVAAGGDTSAATCAAFGVTGMRVWKEIQPGLPSCLSLNDPPRLLVLKSGSFGSPDFLERAIDHLKAQ